MRSFRDNFTLATAILIGAIAGPLRAEQPDDSNSAGVRHAALVSKFTTDQQAIDFEVRQSLHEHVRLMMDQLSPAALRGYRNLVENVYLPHDFDEQVVEELEDLSLNSEFGWAEIVRGQSEATQWSKKREEALKKFGISVRPDEHDKPLQYVVTQDDKWVMNCFACHGGSTYGVAFPGAPNTTYALESLTEQVRRIKLKKKLPLAHMDVGSIAMPLGTTVGTSNAVMFGVALMNYRDKDLNVYPMRMPAAMIHHDMDAPAWWHFRTKTHIYADGFAQKGHRGLMQFMLVRQNGPEQFKEWEKDFRDAYEFLTEVKPPKYPLAIDEGKAERGKLTFNKHCSHCHGTYGNESSYPELNVSLDDIGTDSIRHESLTPQHRKNYGDSWFADYGQQSTISNPDGYTAPPLHGVWVSAPYFHNGSVPTLRGVLFPEARPKVWRRLNESFNVTDVGFIVEGRTSCLMSIRNFRTLRKDSTLTPTCQGNRTRGTNTRSI